MNVNTQNESNRWCKTWLDRVLGFFYPEVCQICGAERAVAKQGYVGAVCMGKVRYITPPFCGRCGLPFSGDLTMPFECSNCRDMELHFTAARSAVTAKGVVLDVIHRYKYKRALWFEPFLAELLVHQATAILLPQDWDCILPVPLHSVKRREREFNQAEGLACRLGHATGIPVRTRWLCRHKPTPTQTHLRRSERAANMRGAFHVAPTVQLNGERIVLVDDVFTTGATTNACAQTLRKAGAGAVCVWTVARGV